MCCFFVSVKVSILNQLFRIFFYLVFQVYQLQDHKISSLIRHYFVHSSGKLFNLSDSIGVMNLSRLYKSFTTCTSVMMIRKLTWYELVNLIYQDMTYYLQNKRIYIHLLTLSIFLEPFKYSNFFMIFNIIFFQQHFFLKLDLKSYIS